MSLNTGEYASEAQWSEWAIIEDVAEYPSWNRRQRERVLDRCRIIWEAIRNTPHYKGAYHDGDKEKISSTWGIKEPIDPKLTFEDIIKSYPTPEDLFTKIPNVLQKERLYTETWLESIEAWRLAEIEGLTYKQIAERKGKNISTISERVKNAKRLVFFDRTILLLPCDDCRYVLHREGQLYCQKVTQDHPHYQCEEIVKWLDINLKRLKESLPRDWNPTRMDEVLFDEEGG